MVPVFRTCTKYCKTTGVHPPPKKKKTMSQRIRSGDSWCAMTGQVAETSASLKSIFLPTKARIDNRHEN